MKEAMHAINGEWRGRENWMKLLILNICLDEGTEWFGTCQNSTHLGFTVLGDTIKRATQFGDFATGGAIWGPRICDVAKLARDGNSGSPQPPQDR